MEPAYREGDIIVVSPAAPIRRGDRVVVKTKDGEVMVKELAPQDREDHRTAIAQCRASGPHAGDVGRAVGRAHRVGEPVSSHRLMAASPRSRRVSNMSLDSDRRYAASR